MGTYNRDAAAAYAIQFTDTRSGFDKYNQDGFGYIDPEKNGKNSGDCTNFASQCLWAGGHPMMGAWTNTTPYFRPGTGTTTWNGTDSLRNFLINTGWAEHVDSKSQLKRGDLVYSVSKKTGEYKHVVVVCRDVEEDGKIYVCGHTANQRDKVRVTPTGFKDYYLHILDSFPTNGTAVYHAGYDSQADFDSAMSDYGKETLHPGETSDYVKNVQNRLKYLGYYSGSASGYFDTSTENAIIDFQEHYNLTADGLPGWKTKNKLYNP